MTAPRIETNTRGQGHRLPAKRRWRVAVSIVAGAAAAASAVTVGGVNFDNEVYQDHLQLIQSQSVRNDNLDDSPFRDVKQDELVDSDLYGANNRLDYVGLKNPGGQPEAWFPTTQGGQFRTSCEFSHFGYDDPILFPDQPGAAHLHMFFGNTDVNAFTTQETLEDSGSGTCNGAELNRSGYWVPAMFDGNGNVRIPDEIIIYYKGEGLANGGPNGNNPNFPNFGGVFDGRPNPGAQIYERGMRNIAPNPLTVPEVSSSDGGLQGTNEVNFKCTDNFSHSFGITTGVNNIPFCDGDSPAGGGSCNPAGNQCRKVLEMEVKFWNCFPTYDETNPNAASNPVVTDWTLWAPSGAGRGGWFFSNCTGRGGGPTGDLDNQETYTNFSYFVNYRVDPGEDTSDWFLSSDVQPSTLTSAAPSLVASGPGSTHHGDVWWEWKDSVLQMALDNCVNFTNSPTASGCATGFLTDGGPRDGTPNPGPALVPREQFVGTSDNENVTVPASQIFAELCQPLAPAHSFSVDAHAAYCTP